MVDNNIGLVYCSAGCSRSSHALSAASSVEEENSTTSAFVAYASSNFVSIIAQLQDYATENVDAFSIIDTPSLRNQQCDVSSVFWFSQDLLLFGSSDGTICLYSRNKRHLCNKKIHAESVTSVHACWFDIGSRFIIASCSADGLVRISLGLVNGGNCSFDGSTFQNIKFGSRNLPLEVNLTKLAFCKSYLLSVGCDDGSVRLFISPLETVNFQQAIQLTGHTDWVNSLATHIASDNLVFLASASQDSTVRLWKLYAADKNSDKNLPKEANTLLADLQKSSTSFECPWFPDKNIFIRLETILKGHTDWVYTVDICIDKETSLMNILTCSIDRSVIVWQEPSDRNSEGIWTESARFARIGGTGSAAGMSYCGARFAQGGRTIVAHSFTGALHAWRRVSNSWISMPMPSGHLGQVSDFAWEPASGQYLLTVGADQTARLHSSWKKSPSLPPIWYEFGRPQIHGYGFNSISTLTSTSFVSAADEKAMRVFSMPRLAKESLIRLCKFETSDEKNAVESGNKNVLGATIAPLGLTNRPYGEDDAPDVDENNLGDELGDEDGEGGGGKGRQKNDDFPVSGSEKAVTSVSVVNDDQPPTPEILIQQTLWPEMRKLYGHGSEVFTVDVSPNNSNRLIASACKATSADVAKIILWAPPNQAKSVDAAFDWRPVQHLEGPTLTVTQLQFSHSGEFLLAVSRDRTWHLYRRDERESLKMTRCAGLEKSTSPHARIIWTCDWSGDDRFFATGSRDQQILIWHLENVLNKPPNFACSITSLPSAVTALAFVPTSFSAKFYVLAAGFESGEITLFKLECGETVSAKELYRFPNNICPSKSISRLRFKPYSQELYLASSSDDWSVRIFHIPKNILS